MHRGPCAASPAPDAGRSTSPGDVAGVPVADRRLAEMLAVLADEFETLDARGQESLTLRFWGLHPDLRERGCSLARVVAWLGWRVVSGRAERASGEAG